MIFYPGAAGNLLVSNSGFYFFHREGEEKDSPTFLLPLPPAHTFSPFPCKFGGQVEDWLPFQDISVQLCVGQRF
jgi:hypothetical protein